MIVIRETALNMCSINPNSYISRSQNRRLSRRFSKGVPGYKLILLAATKTSSGEASLQV